MAKQELRRKILATIATVGGLCCALAVCVWLLLTSSMFSTSIQVLMLVCTGGLAAATIGLCIAKISEIRALQKLVRAEALGLAHVHKPDEGDGHLKPLQTLDTTRVDAKKAVPAVPAQASAPAPAPSPASPAVTKPVASACPTPTPKQASSASQPDSQQARDAQEAQARHWKPIDFSAADARLRAEEQARQRALAEAQQAQAAMEEAKQLERQCARQAQALRAAQAQSAAAQVLAEKQRLAEAQRQAEAQKAAEAQRQAELARRQAEAQKAAEVQRQARQWQAAVPPAQRAADPHRAEQIRLAQAARTGQIPRITDAMIEEQRLAAAARMAEAQRMAKQGISVPQPAAQVAPISQPVPTAAPVQPQPAAQQSAKEQWVHSWQAISLDDDVSAAAPAQPAQPARPRIPHARPVQPAAQAPEEDAAQPKQVHQPVAPPITWPSQPIPSKYYVTGQVPVVTDEMIEAAKRAARDAQHTQH